MKKIFFMAVSAVLLAAGCQKTEIQNEVIPQIGFKTQMGKLTKAPDAEYAGLYDNLIEQDFRVWGYFATAGDLNYALNDNYLGPDKKDLAGSIYVNVTEETHSDGKPVCDTGSETYYWPGKRKELDLYAVSLYSPSKAAADYSMVSIVPSTNTLTVTDFTVDNNADNDLMIAPMIRQDQDDSEFVAPQFKHALTKVLVKFKSTIENVYVVSAQITNVKPQGTLTVKNTPPTEITDGEPINYTAGFTWVPGGTPRAYDAVYNATYNPDGDKAEVIPSMNASASGSDVSTTYTNVIPLNKTSYLTVGSWLLIPHELSDDVENAIADVKLVVEYIVDGVYSSQTFDLAPENATVKAWARNMQTTYNVLISPDYITFEPTVDEWNEVYLEDRGDYDIPAEDDENGESTDEGGNTDE